MRAPTPGPLPGLILGLIATLAAAPLAARRADPEAQLARMLAGRTAGEPLDCIALGPNTPSITFERTAIVYERGRTLYVNRFDQGCSALDDSRILVIRTPSSQLCRGDIAEVVTQSPATFVGSCIFGRFTPYSKAK